MAVTLSCLLFYPSVVSIDKNLEFLSFFRIPAISYSSTVIPIILGIWFMSKIIKVINKLAPKQFKMIFIPFFSLLISTLVTLMLFGPIGYFIGQFLAQISSLLSDNVPILYGAIFGLMYYFIVMTGALYAFFPVMLANISALGYDTGIMPISFFSSILIGSSTFAWSINQTDKNLKQLGVSSAISAMFGVTAPALFGIMTKNKKLLYSIMALSGLINALLSFLSIKAYSFVVPSIFSLPIFIAPTGNNSNIIIAVIGLVLSLVLGFIISLIITKESKSKVQEDSILYASAKKKNPDIIINFE
ncbi:PTS transporter subunit EIIC [Schaalia naturae]|uniref:PTS transporter subunit EIIC n=1 Tax=Schaalia naturae TaxID=635203 RepID=A0ABW2SSN8_9ACTO